MSSKERRIKFPRKSSPRGIEARVEIRIKAHAELKPVGKGGTRGFRKPGSRNPRKVGR